MKPITVWMRKKHNSDFFEHNHIEDGHSRQEAPQAISDVQNHAWKDAEWFPIHGWQEGLRLGDLVDGVFKAVP